MSEEVNVVAYSPNYAQDGDTIKYHYFIIIYLIFCVFYEILIIILMKSLFQNKVTFEQGSYIWQEYTCFNVCSKELNIRKDSNQSIIFCLLSLCNGIYYNYVLLLWKI